MVDGEWWHLRQMTLVKPSSTDSVLCEQYGPWREPLQTLQRTPGRRIWCSSLQYSSAQQRPTEPTEASDMVDADCRKRFETCFGKRFGKRF